MGTPSKGLPGGWGGFDRLFSRSSGELLCHSAVCKSEPKKRQVRSPLTCVHARGGGASPAPPPVPPAPALPSSRHLAAPPKPQAPPAPALFPPCALLPPGVCRAPSRAPLQVFARVTLPSPRTRAPGPPLLLFSPAFIILSDKGGGSGLHISSSSVSRACWLLCLLAVAHSAPRAVLPWPPALGGECTPCPDDLTARNTASLLASTGAVGGGCVGLQILDVPSQPLSDRT